MLDSSGLEPCAGIPELVGNDTYTVEVGIVEVYLTVGISPSVPDRHSLEVNPRRTHEGVVVNQFTTKGRDVVTCEGLSRDVEWTSLESRPLAVEVEEEVDEVISSLICGGYQRDGLVAYIGESDGQRLVDENCVPHDVPCLRQEGSFVLVDADGSQLSEGAELRTASGSTLQPYDEGNACIRDGDAMSIGGEEAVVHAGLAFGVVPIDLLISSVM